MATRLLIPFDGSPAALRAVELLAGYAGDPAALAALLLNVQSRPLSLWPGAGLSAGAIDAALLDDARRTLEPAALRLRSSGIGAEAHVRLGMAAEVILREAAACEAHAVLMGTRGAGALDGFALGSVALRVAHGDVPPVILVKPGDRLPGALGKLEVHLAYVQRPLTMLEQVLPPHD